METQRKTGLGGSLLLQRTDVPERAMPPAAPTQVPDADITVVPAPPLPETVTQAAPQVPRKRKKQALVLRDRCTLYLEREVNDQLDITARIQGRERSEVVSELLRKHLPKYQVERVKHGNE